jgi:signal transduction histidine kinase
MGAVTTWPATFSELTLDPTVLSTAVEASPDGLAVTEAGRVLYSNPAFRRALGLSGAGVLLGQVLSEVVPDIPNGVQISSAAFKSRGREMAVVTARRPAETLSRGQNAAALETMGRLVSGVAHDFNNLLTGMLLYCDLLLVELDGNPRLQAQVREMRTAGEQGGALIQQLLTLARHQVAAPRPILWNDTIAGIKPFLQRLIGENIELTAELDPALEPVEMDAAQMQQTIVNLALNARDAMPEGGKIVLATNNCKASGPSRTAAVEFSVTDTGFGMDAGTRVHIFEPFFSTKRPGQGTGLGLATVHNIVSQHGGTIQVESAPGKGTRVVVRLPRLPKVHKSARKKG